MNLPPPTSREGADMRNEHRPTVPHTSLEARVIALHEVYSARTGYEVRLNLDRQRMWREWVQWGDFSSDDLAHVISYLRIEIRNGKRNDGALKFGNLIGRPDGFEEDLQLAREKRRAPALPTRAKPAQAATPSAATSDFTDDQERAANFRALLSAPMTNDQ